MFFLYSPVDLVPTSRFQSLCQNCLEKLQSAYEFKLRCEENRNYLKEYLIDFENTRAAEERAAKQAAFQELDIDLDNLDALPDKLVLKPNMGKKPRKPRAPRDPAKGPIVRRKRINEKDIIIAENSEKDTAAYVRTVTRNSLQSLEEKGTSKRKSKHVIIQDIEISTPSSKTVNNYSKNGVRKVKRDYKETVYTSNDESIEQKDTNDSSKTESEVLSESDMSEHPAPKRKKKDMNESSKTESEALSESDASEQQAPKKKMTKTVRPHDEPVFEDDSDFEEEYTAPKREKRSRK